MASSTGFPNGGGEVQIGVSSLVSQDVSQKIKYMEGGKIQLPNGKVYQVNIHSGENSRSLTEDEIAQHVVKILENSQLASNFTYQDLSQTKITAEGIYTDQAKVEEGAEGTDTPPGQTGVIENRRVTLIKYDGELSLSNFIEDYESIKSFAQKAFQEMPIFLPTPAPELSVEVHAGDGPSAPTDAGKVPTEQPAVSEEKKKPIPAIPTNTLLSGAGKVSAAKPAKSKALPAVPTDGRKAPSKTDAAVTTEKPTIPQQADESPEAPQAHTFTQLKLSEEPPQTTKSGYTFGFERAGSKNKTAESEKSESSAEVSGRRIENTPKNFWKGIKRTGRGMQKSIARAWGEMPKWGGNSEPGRPENAHLLTGNELQAQTEALRRTEAQSSVEGRGKKTQESFDWKQISSGEMRRNVEGLGKDQKLKMREGKFRIGATSSTDIRPQGNKKSSDESIGIMKGMVGELERRSDGIFERAQSVKYRQEPLLSDKKEIDQLLKEAKDVQGTLKAINDSESEWVQRVLVDSGEKKGVPNLSNAIESLISELEAKQTALEANPTLKSMSKEQLMFRLVNPSEEGFRSDFLQSYRRLMTTEELFTGLEDIQTAIKDLRLAINTVNEGEASEKMNNYSKKKEALESKLGTSFSNDALGKEFDTKLAEMEGSISTLVQSWAKDMSLSNNEFTNSGVKKPLENLWTTEWNRKYESFRQDFDSKDIEEQVNLMLATSEIDNLHALSQQSPPKNQDQLENLQRQLNRAKAEIEDLDEPHKTTFSESLKPFEELIGTAAFISGIEGTSAPERVSPETKVPEHSDVSYFTGFQSLVKGELNPTQRSELIESLSSDLFELNVQIMSDIHTTEFVKLAWEKKPENAPNLTEAMATSDRINAFFAINLVAMTSIPEGTTETEATRDSRVEVLKFLIDLQKSCVDKGDFNSAMIIQTLMDSSALTTLKQTNAALPEEYQAKAQQLKDLLSPEGSFKKMNDQIAERKETNKPYVPLLLNTTRTLVSLEEAFGANLTEGNGNINMNALTSLANPVTSFKSWQQTTQPKKLQNNLANDLENVYSMGAAMLESRFEGGKNTLAQSISSLQDDEKAATKLQNLLFDEAKLIEPKATEIVKNLANNPNIPSEKKEKIQTLVDLIFVEKDNTNVSNMNENAAKYGIILGDPSQDNLARLNIVKKGMARKGLDELEKTAKKLKKDGDITKEERNSILQAIGGCRDYFQLN